MGDVLQLTNVNTRNQVQTVRDLTLRVGGRGTLLASSPEEETVIKLEGIVRKVSRIGYNKRIEVTAVPGGYILSNYLSDKGVSVNGYAMDRGRIARLHDQDRIAVHLTTKIVYVDVNLIWQRRHALLVAGHADKADATENDVKYLGKELEKRLFEVEILKGADIVTRKRVIEELKRKREEMTRGSDFWFSYHGRGAETGISIYGDVLSAKLFYDLFQRIRGRKVAFFDNCFSGRMITGVNLNRIPSKTIVLASCHAQEHAVERIVSGKGRMGEFTAALVEYLEKPEDQEVSLIDFFDDLYGGLATRQLRNQIPDFRGEDYILRPKITREVL
jgi:hypothetical protein